MKGPEMMFWGTIACLAILLSGFLYWGSQFIRGYVIWFTKGLPGWNRYVCKIRLLEPLGPDPACKRVCKDHEWCERLSRHG